MPRTRSTAAAVAAAILFPAAAAAQQDVSQVEIRTVHVADEVYMLMGSGGNIGLSVGADGAFLVDDEFAPLTDKILAAIRAVRPEPVKFLVNTHWHGDHTGGNENLGKAGTIIIAHENVRKRMSTEQFIALQQSTIPASPPAALPIITFTDAVTFYWNGDSVRVWHVRPAHTDGDAIIQFQHANVIHMGDTFFQANYPFIDMSSGGSIDGMIAAADQVLALADPSTKIIPGHGELSDAAGLAAYRDMLVEVRTRVAALIAAGKSREETVAAKPTASFDARWGGSSFMPPDVFVGIVYDSMTEQ